MTKAFILNKLKSQINPQVSDEKRRAAVAERLSMHPTGVLPLMPKTRIKRVNRFIEKVLASQASLEQISRRNAANAIGEFLRAHNLPGEVRMGDDERLKIVRTNAKGLVIKDGRSDGLDLASVSHAEAGVVETGTLALFSGKDNPTTLNFLPENHIVMVRESDIVAHYEDVFAVTRARYGVGKHASNPEFHHRAVTFGGYRADVVVGCSRTDPPACAADAGLKRMDLQNRVSPDGELHAVRARGMFTGNRGIIHDPDQKHTFRAPLDYIRMDLLFAGMEGQAARGMGQERPERSAGWTELFFLDEVTALAAGHRPCHTCRSEDALRFHDAFCAGHGTTDAKSKNEVLHRERWLSSRTKPTAISTSQLTDLPDGSMVKSGSIFYAIKDQTALHMAF